MKTRSIVALGALAVAAFLVVDSVYTVDQTEQALVLQLGQVVGVERTPGLKFKIPFVQNVVLFEKRVLDVDPPAEQVLLSDQRRLNVDAFARYQIADPLLFYQSARTEEGARARLASMLNGALRRVMGTKTQQEVLSGSRASIMGDIRNSIGTEAAQIGVKILDVRIIRADVPEGTLQSVFGRMRSEREREAAEYRAQGQEQALEIRSRAERERTVLTAEAESNAQVVRGQGDAEAIRIQADAYGADPSFFSFYRSIQAYRTALSGQSTTLVLSPTGEFFRYFNNMDGSADVAAVPAPAAAAPPAVAVPPAPAAAQPAPSAAPRAQPAPPAASAPLAPSGSVAAP
jgi:membrane protease subunit HflC